MNLLKKILFTGGTVAALALSSTAAFACTTPGNGNPGGGPVLTGDPCSTIQPDSISWHASQGDTLLPDTTKSGNCKPVDPKPCSWDRIPVTSWVWQHGRYVKCVKDENWNECTPKPVTPPEPKCHCKVQNITFETPTYGSWLLDTGGPALHNGEVIKYDGQDWTVGDWTTPPSKKATGSQGPGDYFTLTLDGHQLDGHGIKTQWATTICTNGVTVWTPAPIPVGNPGNGCTPKSTVVSSTDTTTPDVITYDSGSPLVNGEEVVAPAYGTTDYWVFDVHHSGPVTTFELSTTQNTDTVHVNGDVADWTLTSVCSS